MLTHIRTWQVIALQLAIGGLSALFMAMVIHYPDVARRPEPQSGKLFLAFFLFLAAAVLTLLAAGVRSERANTAWVITSTIGVWLLGSYALVYLWINTYGT
jgi:hypothetical protein